MSVAGVVLEQPTDNVCVCLFTYCIPKEDVSKLILGVSITRLSWCKIRSFQDTSRASGSLLLGPSFLLPYRDCICTDVNKILAGIHGQRGDTAA